MLPAVLLLLLAPPMVVVVRIPAAVAAPALPRRLAEMNAERAVPDAVPIQGLDGGGRLDI
jgi:hypothetical protein